VCLTAACHSLVHVILFCPFCPLPFRKVALSKKKNDQCRRLRRDQCFTIHKQPSMLPNKKEEIVIPRTASSPLPRRLLPESVVHVPFWFFSFYFSLFRRSLFLARCRWPWLGYGCFNHVRLPVCGSLPVMQTCYILGLRITGSEGSRCTRCKNVAFLLPPSGSFLGDVGLLDSSTSFPGTA
jgi:hypothetical protein